MNLFGDSQYGYDFVARLRQADRQRLSGLLGFQLSVAQQVDKGDGFAEMLVAFGQRLDDELAVCGPSHSGGVEILLGLVEPNVAGVHVAVLAVVESLGAELDVLIGHGSLAESHPRARAEDALAVDRHPSLQVV